MRSDSPALLTDMLQQVSRSFYKTLRVLPRSIRRPIGLAYLLARTTDTIADTPLLPLQQRLAALDLFRGRILGLHREELSLGSLADRQGSPAERRLLEHAEEAVGLLDEMAEPDRELIREVLQIITSGQELDLRRFAGASVENIVALQTEQDLADYTYRVAGCVGEFWTKMCRAHVFPRDALDDAFLLGRGVRFGQGLQLVNILRDLPADLRQGRCYLPAEQLAGAGLKPSDLLHAEVEPRLRPVYDAWLRRAEAHLAAGWEYTNALPWRCPRIRLACAWPILIGVRTLSRLRTGGVLDGSQRIKIGRAEVRGLILRSLWRYPWPPAWRKLVL